MQIVRKNFGLKLLALVLAIVGWAYVRFAANPIIAEAQFDQRFTVPIVAEHLSPGYVADFSRREATVVIELKRGQPTVRPGEIQAVLDLTNKPAGAYNVPVELMASDVAVQSLSPGTVAVTIERAQEPL